MGGEIGAKALLAAPMSAAPWKGLKLVEEECRLLIAHAYAEWHLKAHPGELMNLLDYERALGLEPPF